MNEFSVPVREVPDQVLHPPRASRAEHAAPSPTGAGAFPPTAWSVVLAASDGSPAEVLAALDRLARSYWRPLYRFARQRGQSHEDAADSVQGFFAHLLNRDFLHNVAPGAGRFRTFLLACFVRWLRDQWVRTTALKRGAGIPLLILEDETHAEWGSHGDAESPEVSFDRHWARELLSTTLRRLSESWAARPELFAALKESLVSGGSPPQSYAEIAVQMGMTEGAVKKAAFDFRCDFGRLLRREVRRTVERDEDVDGELRHLVSLFRDPDAGQVAGAPLANAR
ncbi:MAG: sigma-70 family RNA polymerase sigma factor [Verrucomicrobiae bacterium]|nr:sigma-70 family RNA polymerase sigma factor [Verrucomicrobiae bacterium]